MLEHMEAPFWLAKASMPLPNLDRCFVAEHGACQQSVLPHHLGPVEFFFIFTTTYILLGTPSMYKQLVCTHRFRSHAPYACSEHSSGF